MLHARQHDVEIETERHSSTQIETGVGAEGVDWMEREPRERRERERSVVGAWTSRSFLRLKRIRACTVPRTRRTVPGHLKS
jgi:hypothetical protein